MKKSLLALALLGTFAGMASAQTNVTIYGVVDAGISRFDNGTASVTRLDSGIQSGSRIGFRGAEDLGGGLSAIFTLENGFALDDGTLGQGSRLFGRQAFVGLNGGFGAVKFGRQYNPVRNLLGRIDPFEHGLAGNIGGVFNNYGERNDNTISYATPKMGGFSGELTYSLGEVVGSNSVGRQVGLGVGYAAGPFSIEFAHHDNNVNTNGVDGGNAKTSLLGGTYDFGVAKLHAAYAINDGETAAGATNVDSKDAMLGVSAKLGAGRVLASYMRRSNDLVANADTNVIALGYTYDLSKRTNLYTSYARFKNDGAARLGGAAAAGQDPSVFNVGVRHKF